MNQTFLQKYGDVELRYLGWKQPFASLMLHGKIETRVWDTKYRGWVLITASKGTYNTNQIEDISGVTQGYRILKQFNGDIKSLPTGKAIAVGRLVDSRPMTVSDEDACFVQYKEPWVVPVTRDFFGTPVTTYKNKQLWCHVYEDVQPIEPLEWYGNQGWNTLDVGHKEKIFLL